MTRRQKWIVALNHALFVSLHFLYQSVRHILYRIHDKNSDTLRATRDSPKQNITNYQLILTSFGH